MWQIQQNDIIPLKIPYLCNHSNVVLEQDSLFFCIHFVLAFACLSRKLTTVPFATCLWLPHTPLSHFPVLPEGLDSEPAQQRLYCDMGKLFRLFNERYTCIVASQVRRWTNICTRRWKQPHIGFFEKVFCVSLSVLAEVKESVLS